jgi:hypothetical protein
VGGFAGSLELSIRKKKNPEYSVCDAGDFLMGTLYSQPLPPQPPHYHWFSATFDETDGIEWSTLETNEFDLV